MFKSFTIYLLCATVLLSACTRDLETCYSSSDPYLTKAISIKLDSLGFAYATKNSDKYQLCFKQSKKDEFDRIQYDVMHYYGSVATVLRSPESKDAVFFWLNESGTPYSTHENERGTFVMIGSLTEEKASENAIKLDELLHGN